jgi:excinuclease ABC subunit A
MCSRRSAGCGRDEESGNGATGAASAPQVFSTKRACPVCGTSYPELDPRLFSYNSKHGWCTTCVGTGVKLSKEQRKALDDSVRTTEGARADLCGTRGGGRGDVACPDCEGTRLNATARAVRFGGREASPTSIAE